MNLCKKLENQLQLLFSKKCSLYCSRRHDHGYNEQPYRCWWLYQQFGVEKCVCICCGDHSLLTGGIHVVGYMDTMDALHSYYGNAKN